MVLPSGQPKPQNIPDVLGEHKFIMLENFETIYISTNRTGPFMSLPLIAGSVILCHFMPNDRSLWNSSLMPSIPPQKFSCCLEFALYIPHKVHLSCFRIESRHTKNGLILLKLLEFPCLCGTIESCRISVGFLKQNGALQHLEIKIMMDGYKIVWGTPD